MRTMLRGLVVVSATSLFAATVVSSASAQRAERKLMGISIWRTFKDVLALHGQPTRIEIGAVSGGAGGGAGGGGGGGGGMGAGMESGMGAGPSSMGGMSMGGRGKMGGGASTGAMGGGLPGMGGPSGGGMMGSGGRGNGSGSLAPPPGSRPDMAGGGFGGSGLLSPGGGGPGGGMSGGDPGQPAAENEVTWIYEKGPLTYMFLFNKDGRVIQIQEYGYAGGGPTGLGARLGDPVRKIYQLYGWAGFATKSGPELTLDYSQKQHVAFQLHTDGKNAKVVGITVALTERSGIPGGP